MGAAKTVALDWEEVGPVLKRVQGNVTELVNTINILQGVIGGLTESASSTDKTVVSLHAAVERIYENVKDTPPIVDDMCVSLERQAREIEEANEEAARAINSI